MQGPAAWPPVDPVAAPRGQRLPQFSPDSFTDRDACEWGQAVDFDGPGAAEVREFVLRHAEYSIAGFHAGRRRRG